MINPVNLSFGDTVYVVDEINNAFSKKRITMVDDNGVEWYRYDRDHWEYSVSELIYCGRTTVIKDGEVSNDHDFQNQLHFKYPDGSIYYEYESDVGEVEEWFHTRAEAEAYVETMRKLKNND